MCPTPSRSAASITAPCRAITTSSSPYPAEISSSVVTPAKSRLAGSSKSTRRRPYSGFLLASTTSARPASPAAINVPSSPETPVTRSIFIPLGWFSWRTTLALPAAPA
nr:hypothetical protein GCM10020093_044820 [Planobispora longispora]